MINLRVRAASFILCNDDIPKALELLDSCEGNEVPNDVIVHSRFEGEDMGSLMDAIEDLAWIMQQVKDGK